MAVRGRGAWGKDEEIIGIKQAGHRLSSGPTFSREEKGSEQFGDKKTSKLGTMAAMGR